MSAQHIAIIGSATDILPFLIGLYFWRDLTGYLKILWIFFLFTVLSDVIFVYLAFHKMHNLWPLNAFILLRYSFLLYVFSCWQKKKEFRFSIPLFLSIWIGFKVSGMSIGDLYYYFSTIESVILVAVSAYTLYSLNSDNVITIYKYPQFWISCAVLIYFAGNVILFASSRIEIIDTKLMGSFWLIHSGLNIIANLFYSGGFVSQHFQISGSSSPGLQSSFS